MDAELKAIAQTCLNASLEGTLSFPEIVRKLIEAGYESYTVDFRQGRTTYFLASGESVELPTPSLRGDVAAAFEKKSIEAAIGEAQSGAPGYTYAGFCRKVRAAGCAGYMVSFLGRRAVYYGRTCETHVELFPQSQ